MSCWSGQCLWWNKTQWYTEYLTREINTLEHRPNNKSPRTNIRKTRLNRRSTGRLTEFYAIQFIMHKIIMHVKNSASGYPLITGKIKILCHADNTVILSDNEDDLQKCLHSFLIVSKQHMSILKEKTISSIIIKKPLRGKLVVEIQIIEQVLFYSTI